MQNHHRCSLAGYSSIKESDQGYLMVLLELGSKEVDNKGHRFLIMMAFLGDQPVWGIFFQKYYGFS